MGEPAAIGPELERVAGRSPDRPAVSDDSGAALTYGELLEAALAQAATLAPQAGESPRPVALLMPHRAETVVAIAAALLARRPFCTLDPTQPRRRIEALLEEIRPDIVWAGDAALRRKLALVGLEVAAPPVGASPAPYAPRSEATGEICAYYLTSGSTGEPKLVGYRHHSTLRRARLYAESLGAGPDDRFSLVSPMWTAASASALFTALLTGASVHLIEPARLTPGALARRVADARITVWHSTPSVFRRLATSGALAASTFRALRLGGEPLLEADLELARTVCPADALLVTGYSITEANGAVTQRVAPLTDGGMAADAGPALEGVQLWISDGEGAPAPAGTEGEIAVSGPQLSAGYQGRAEAEAGTRFTTLHGERILLTGDRGVLGEDGSLEVRGRADRRLKLRGHRVDPAEIEDSALRYASVRAAAAVPFETQTGATAIALFAATGEAKLEPSALRAHLQQRLAPEAMPAVVRAVPELPLTAGGKLDRERLASLVVASAGARGPQRGRTDPVADHLLRLFADALEIQEPGPGDDFFVLGGDSLAAAEVCAGIEITYGVPLEPAALLRHGSAAALAEHVRGVLVGQNHAAASLLHLNPAGGEQPLFAIPGAGSEATALVHFAEAIGAEQPVNVIQLPGADGRTRPLTRMDDIAAHCLAAIRDSDAEAPYRLGGTSFGGLVAYALAAELLSEGGEVEYVGLFDAPAPATRRKRADERGPKHDYRSVLSLRLGVPWQPPPKLRFRHLRLACSIAAERWTPPPLECTVHLYRCDSQPPHLAVAPYLGWDGYASRIELRPLATSHGRHIRPPAVNHLAEAVARDLGRAEAPQAVAR